MPEPGTWLGRLANAADRVEAAGAKVQQNAREAAAQAARQGSQDGPGRPEGPGEPLSPAQQQGTRQ